MRKISSLKGIRGKLLLLLLIVLIPALLIEAFIFYRWFVAQKSDELQGNLEVARAAARSFDSFLHGVIDNELTIGLAITASNPMTSQDRDRMLDTFMANNPEVRSIFFMNSEGTVIASSLRSYIGFNFSDRSYFQKVKKAQDWAVSELIVGRVTGKPAFTVSRAMRNENGELLGVVAASVEPDRLERVLGVVRPGDAGLSLIDDKGVFVCRYPPIEFTWEERNWLKRYPMLEDSLKGKEVITKITLESTGKGRLVAFTPIPSIGWVAEAGRGEDQVINPIISTLLFQGGMVLLVMVVGFWAAVALARPITRSIVELRNHALALGRGDMENTVPASGLEEIKELAVAFNRMAEEVRSREVSLQKEHEKAVWLGRFPEQDPNPVFRVSADGVVLYCNTAAAAKSYGWNCEVGQLVQKDLLPLVSRALTEQEEVQQDLEIGGKIYVVWAVPFRAESYVNVYARDITERKEAEMKLEETGRSLESQRNLLQYIIDSTKNSHLVYLDRDFNFVRVNETYARTCGYTPQEMVGKNHFDLYPHKENEAIFVRVRDMGVPVEFHDKPFVFPDQPERGTTYWDWTLTPVKDPEGAVKGLVFSLFETTERKRMEEDLRKSRDELEERVRERTAELEKANTRLRQYNKRLEALNKELQDFAFVASHDLQEPLRKVRTFGDMLAANCGASLDETSKNYIERMQRAAARMQDLINSLLSYSRLTTHSEPMDEMDLRESVETALSNLEMIIRERNARVEVDDLPRVRADRVQMIQLFQNLIGNALKFHRDSQPPHVKIYSQQAEGKKRYHEIYIEDHGIGFDEKYLDKIFLPFQRLHGRNSEYDGVGMGLAICKKIVERHGGEITAKGELGKGSTFIVTLPSGRKLR